MGASEVNTLILVLGNPWRRYPREYQWCEVTYRLDGGIECRDEIQEYVARTTLPILYNCIKPDHMIIIAQDTLLVKEPQGNSYKDVIRIAEEVVREFLESVDRKLYEDIKDKIKIIVAPGLGRFVNTLVDNSGERQVEVNVCGSLQDFYSYLFHKLAYSLLRVISKSWGGDDAINLKVHLDLSHGINYMPALTLKALLDIIPVIAAYIDKGNPTNNSQGTRVTLITYNSEPVTRCGREHTYTIHVVEKLTVRDGGSFKLAPSLVAFENLKLMKANDACIRDPKRVREVGRGIGEASNRIVQMLGLDKNMLSAFAGSLVNGLPLLLARTMPRTDLNSYVDRILEKYIGTIEISTSSDNRGVKVEVHRKAKLAEASTAVAKLLLAKELIKITCEKARVKCEVNNDGSINLEDLEKLTPIAYSWSERLKTVISWDLWNIKKAVGNKRLEGWVKLYEILGDKSKCEDIFGSDLTRHFLQHSGLQMCIVDVKVENNNIMLRYDPEFEVTVMDMTSKGLVKI